MDLLTEKTALFLLNHFHELFKNRGKSKLHKKNQYKLATLGEIVDLKCLPTGYSTNMPPLANTCDHCRKELDDGEVLVCGHGYHLECYQIMNYGCRHCEEYYKRGIYSNVDSFLKRLEKGPEVLTSEEKENENFEDVDENDTVKIAETSNSQEIHTTFLNILHQVIAW